MRWLGDITLFEASFWPQVLDQVILSPRVASAAGDAGLRARVLQATDLLERERPAIPLFTGVARHARGILERDAQALLAAAKLLHSSSRSLLYAAAAEDAGAELARTDRGDEAVDQLNAAFDTYMGHEALTDARRVGRELRQLGVQHRIVSQPRAKTGWDRLTDSELKVVNLIAQGATNRSVAQQLHVTPHTVKTHLHNTFAKLGITSRAQLTQLMHGSDGPGATPSDVFELCLVFEVHRRSWSSPPKLGWRRRRAAPDRLNAAPHRGVFRVDGRVPTMTCTAMPVQQTVDRTPRGAFNPPI